MRLFLSPQHTQIQPAQPRYRPRMAYKTPYAGRTPATPAPAQKYELLYATVLSHWRRSHCETSLLQRELCSIEAQPASTALRRALVLWSAALQRRALHRKRHVTSPRARGFSVALLSVPRPSPAADHAPAVRCGLDRMAEMDCQSRQKKCARIASRARPLRASERPSTPRTVAATGLTPRARLEVDASAVCARGSAAEAVS